MPYLKNFFKDGGPPDMKIYGRWVKWDYLDGKYVKRKIEKRAYDMWAGIDRINKMHDDLIKRIDKLEKEQ